MKTPATFTDRELKILAGCVRAKAAEHKSVSDMVKVSSLYSPQDKERFLEEANSHLEELETIAEKMQKQVWGTEATDVESV